MARDKLGHQFEKFKKSNSPEGLRFGRKTSRMGATGYFTHPQCMKHEMGAGHPECPERLSAIEDRLLITGLDMALQRREAGPAALADIELAHGRMHVAFRVAGTTSPCTSRRISDSSMSTALT